MELNLADLFELVADEVPDAAAMVSGARRLTYRQLDLRADRLAHHLAAAGIGSGDRVGVQLANGTEYVEAMLACFKVQAVQDGQGGYMVMADVSGQNAADQAVGLARYYYVTEVRVGQNVYNKLFAVSDKSTFAVKIGTLKGSMNSGPADLKFNKSSNT